MNKQDRNYSRLAEVSRLLHIFETNLRQTKREHPMYHKYILRIDELKLEFQERSGAYWEANE